MSQLGRRQPQPSAIILGTLGTPAGQVPATVTDTETVSTTTATSVSGPGTQPIVVTAEPSKAFWNQARQPPAIVSATPPGQLTASVTDTETVVTTATATTSSAQPPATQPIVVSDLTGTYWQLERQRPAIVVIQPPGKVTADVSDTETVSTTATASVVAPTPPPQPIIVSDQLGPYLRRALSHQPPALVLAPPAGTVTGQVSDTITVLTTATATGGGNVTGDIADTETATTTASATATAPGPGSWWKLVALRQQSFDELDLTAQVEDGYCPHDGTMYVSNAQGALICPFDGYSPDPGAVRATQGQRALTPALEEWRELDAWHPNVDPAEVYW